MKKLSKLWLSIVITIVLIVLLVASFLLGKNLDSSDKLFSIGKVKVTKEEVLWELYKKDYTESIQNRLKEEIFLANTKIKKEVRNKVEKSMLNELGVKNKEEYVKKENLTEDEYNKKVDVTTAIVQQLIDKDKITKKEIEVKSLEQSAYPLFNLYVAKGEEAKIIEDGLKNGFSFEDAVHKANDNYSLNYQWNLKLEELSGKVSLNEEQIQTLYNLKEQGIVNFENDGGKVFIEFSKNIYVEPEKLYKQIVYQIAEEDKITEESVFEELKKKTNIKYFDQKYFK